MSYLTDPVIALFLSLGLGHLIGRIRIGPVALGGVCGTLFVALAIGQLGVAIPAEMKDTAFALFIYALGFTAGPQFFANIRGGLRYTAFPLIEIVVSLGLTLAAVAALNLDPGTAAGLFAGSATESAVLGTASEAIGKLSAPAEQLALFQANMVTAYSLTYLFGLISIVLFVTQVAPFLVGRDIRKEAQALADELAGGDDAAGAGLPVIVERAYEVGGLAGCSVRDFEETRNWTVVIQGVLHEGALAPVGLDHVLRAGDVVLLRGRRNTVMAASKVLGPEVPVPADAGFAAISKEVVLVNAKAFGREARDLRKLVDPETQRGIFLTDIRRMGQAVPALPKTVVEQGDVLTLYGPEESVLRAVKELGHPLPAGDSTDFVLLGLGVVVGLAIGHLAVRIGALDLTLGLGGGALIAGLVFGWLNMRHPRHGAFPEAAAHFAKEFGLSAFIAAIGLGAGPAAVAAIKENGLLFPILGVVLSVAPAFVSLLIGTWLFRIRLPILLGAIAGQHCSTPALSAVVAQAGNGTPVIGYTVTYAIANVLLPLMGPIVIALSHAIGGAP